MSVIKGFWNKEIPDTVHIDEEIKTRLDAIGVAGKMIYDDFIFNFAHFHVDPKATIGPNVTSIKAKLQVGSENKEIYFNVPSFVVCVSNNVTNFYILPMNEDGSFSYPLKHISLSKSSMGGYHEYHHHITKKESFIKSLEHLLHKI